ncbi:GntR family transcriptional regulator [Pelagibius sp.]|uniref:GntR family transcriptional regulator n=1 Tax=Pelagibius sp. TaxID=1931238 RepID=UPI003BAF0D32
MADRKNLSGIRVEGSTPLYAEVRAVIAERIDEGEYAPSDPLPSASALAKEFGVSLITVKRALKELKNEGLLTSRAGLGTFVKRPRKFVRDFNVSLNSMADVQRLGFSSRIELISVGLEKPNLPPAEGDDLPDTDMLCVKKLIHADDSPVMYDVSYVSEDLGEEFRETIRKSLIYDALERMDIRVKKVDLTIEAAPASAETQRYCNVPNGYPCLVRRYRYRTSRAGLYVVGQVESPFDRLSCTLSMER